MAKRVFTDYYMADGERLKGYTAANIAFGINAADSGMLIELEREIDNVVLGIDIFMTQTMRNWKSRARFRRNM